MFLLNLFRLLEVLKLPGKEFQSFAVKLSKRIETVCCRIPPREFYNHYYYHEGYIWRCGT